MADFAGFQEQGYRLTEKEIAVLEREIIKVYREAQKALTADLTKVYAKLAGIDPTDAGYYNELLKRDRLTTLQQTVTATYNKYANFAGVKTATASKLAITNNYYRQLYTSAWGTTVTFGALPEELVNLATYGTDKAWKAYTKTIAKKFGAAGLYQPKEGTLSSFLLKNKKADLAKIRQAVTQGLIQGVDLRAMTKSIKDITGRELIKDGKKVLTGAKANAMRIIRTETGRIMNAGAFAQTKLLESEGIAVQKRWLATLDVSTRARHAALDDKTINPDEPFTIGSDTAMYPGDFGSVKNNANCRCSVIDIIPDFEPDVRTGRNPGTERNEVFGWKNYDEWVKDNGLKRSKSGRMVKA